MTYRDRTLPSEDIHLIKDTYSLLPCCVVLVFLCFLEQITLSFANTPIIMPFLSILYTLSGCILCSFIVVLNSLKKCIIWFRSSEQTQSLSNGATNQDLRCGWRL